MAHFAVLTSECTNFLQSIIFNVIKRLHKIKGNQFSKYWLYLNFTDHYLSMSQQGIIPNFANHPDTTKYSLTSQL